MSIISSAYELYKITFFYGYEIKKADLGGVYHAWGKRNACKTSSCNIKQTTLDV